MGLQTLRRKLYRAEESLSEHEKTAFNTEEALRTTPPDPSMPSQWQEQEKVLLERHYRKPLLWIAVVMGAIVLGVVALWTLLNIRASLFSPSDITLTIEGPTAIRAGMTAEYAITLHNGSSTRLRDIVVDITHPPAFSVEMTEGLSRISATAVQMKLGNLDASQKQTIILRGKFGVEFGDVMYIAADVSFTPTTRRAPLTVTQRKGLRAESEGMNVSVEAQRTVSSGERIVYTIRYENTSQTPYDHVVLTAEMPSQFTYESSTPARDDETATRWDIGTVSPGTEGVIQITGTLHGVRDTVHTATFTLQQEQDGTTVPIARAQWATRITTPPIVITQTVNGRAGTYIAQQGDTLVYTIDFNNVGDLGVRDAVVQMEFEDQILDYAKLNLAMSGGVLNPKTKTIIWRASDVPSLELLSPSEGGQITFSIPVQSNLPVQSDTDSNLVVRTRAFIDSPDIPTPIYGNKRIESAPFLVKLASRVTFTTEGFYDDFTLKNTGPVPPKRGAKTTYTIRWSVTNATNTLQNAVVEASLPTHVTWEGVTFPESETIQFNPRTHKIIWQLGEVKNGTGYFRKKREVRFQISVTPTQNDVGKMMRLLHESTFRAHDVFVDRPVVITTQEKTTQLSEDIRAGDGQVQP